MSENDNQSAEAESSRQPRRYFAMIPHMVDDLPLSVYAYRLYGHIVRRAGQDGACFEGIRKMARCIGCSPQTIVEAKRELQRWSLIIIERRHTDDGGYLSDWITLRPIEEVNETWMTLGEKEKQKMISDFQYMFKTGHFPEGSE